MLPPTCPDCGAPRIQFQIIYKRDRWTKKLIHLWRCGECWKRAPLGEGLDSNVRMLGWNRIKTKGLHAK